jgi:hypothetical protein
MASSQFYFKIYDLRSTYATRLSAGGDAKVFKEYSRMNLQMKREALEKTNRQPNEMPPNTSTGSKNGGSE